MDHLIVGFGTLMEFVDETLSFKSHFFQFGLHLVKHLYDYVFFFVVFFNWSYWCVKSKANLLLCLCVALHAVCPKIN